MREVLTWGGVAVAALTIIAIIDSRKMAQAKVAWIFWVLMLPWIGALSYLAFGRRRLERKVLRLRRRRGAAFDALEEAWAGRRIVPRRAPATLSRELTHGLEHLGALPPINGNEVSLFWEGEEAFAAGAEEVRSARDHVHLETYIFKQDLTGRETLDLLVDAARRGVEVRVLVDGVGSYELGARFFEPLVEAGGRVSTFLPISRWRSGIRINLRNHRKLMIVDGHSALTGGMNIGDEYLHRKDWRDLHLRVRGPAVPALQRIFAEDWHFATAELLDADRYFFLPPPAGEVAVQVVDSGPDQMEPRADDLMFGALAAAHRSIDVVTPYLVLPRSIEQVLCSAARRGRRVRILLPEFVDHRLVRWATDAGLPVLLDAGVRVWRYPGMMHSKVLVVDGEWSTMGSINLDMRSLQLNFELNVAIPGRTTAEAVLRHVEAEIARSRELAPGDLDCSPVRRFARNVAHLFSPCL